jgi:hypothetical protein
MSGFAISLAFLMLGGQPPTDTAAPAPAATEAPKPEPKMVCKYENITGSRVQKQKVCRPENQDSSAFQDTTLQRDLSRLGNIAPPTPGMGAPQ